MHRSPAYYAGWSAEEIATNEACIQAGEDMRTMDGLLDPKLDAVFSRLAPTQRQQDQRENAQ